MPGARWIRRSGCFTQALHRDRDWQRMLPASPPLTSTGARASGIITHLHESVKQKTIDQAAYRAALAKRMPLLPFSH
jgi:hypothetical protein